MINQKWLNCSNKMLYKYTVFSRGSSSTHISSSSSSNSHTSTSGSRTSTAAPVIVTVLVVAGVAVVVVVQRQWIRCVDYYGSRWSLLLMNPACGYSTPLWTQRDSTRKQSCSLTSIPGIFNQYALFAQVSVMVTMETASWFVACFMLWTVWSAPTPTWLTPLTHTHLHTLCRAWHSQTCTHTPRSWLTARWTRNCTHGTTDIRWCMMSSLLISIMNGNRWNDGLTDGQ